MHVNEKLDHSQVDCRKMWYLKPQK